MKKINEEYSNGIFIYPDSEKELNIRRFRDVLKGSNAMPDKIEYERGYSRNLDPDVAKSEKLGFVKPRPEPRFIENLMGEEFRQVNPRYKHTPRKSRTEVLQLEKIIKPLRKRRPHTNREVMGSSQFFGSSNVSSFENYDLIQEIEESPKKGIVKKILKVFAVLMILGFVFLFLSKHQR